MTPEEYASGLFLRDNATLTMTQEGKTFLVTIKPEATEREVSRLKEKATLVNFYYQYGVVFLYENEDSTFGPLGRFGAGCPRL